MHLPDQCDQPKATIHYRLELAFALSRLAPLLVIPQPKRHAWKRTITRHH
jgi:hypothetical protein